MTLKVKYLEKRTDFSKIQIKSDDYMFVPLSVLDTDQFHFITLLLVSPLSKSSVNSIYHTYYGRTTKQKDRNQVLISLFIND